MKQSSVVLVVEDEEESRELLHDLIALEGFDVEVAADGRQALARIDELGDRLGLVLLDMVMPVMDGWQVLERLRTGGHLDKLKVVVTTSAPHRVPADVPVVPKPLDIGRVLRLVKASC